MTDTWNSPQVNKKGVMKAYVDEYDNHAFGILQEDSQNGFDAYVKGTRPSDMKILFLYNADERRFFYHDYNTIGMPHCSECEWGIKKDGTPCTNEECSWGCYHNLAYSGKSGHSLGSRGMGKSLRIESGEKTVIKTTLPDKRFMASTWQMVDGDWKWKKSPEEARELTYPGTEMVTYGVIEKVHNKLIKFDDVIQFLQEKWFRLIEQGAEIEYKLIQDGAQHKRFIQKIKYPVIETPDKDKPTVLKKNSIIVKYLGKRVGELRNLEIQLAKDPFDDEDPRQGIALVKNGKQTITRYNQFPTDIPENIRRRIFGYVDANCETEPFLNDAENSTHTGYQWTDPTYKAVRYELNKIVREFSQPFMKIGGERITEKEQKEAKEILSLINKTLLAVPELQIFGLYGEGPSGKIETKPKTLPYISRLEPNNQRFNKGQTINVKTIIKNPVEKEMMIDIEFNFYDPTPVVIKDRSSTLLLHKGNPDEPSTLEENWSIPVDDSMVPGIYWIQVKLKDRTGTTLEDEKKKPIKMRASIHIDQDPPTIIRGPRTGTGTGTHTGERRGGEGEGGLSNLYAIKRSDLPDIEIIIEMPRAYAFYNRYGRRFKYLNERSQKRTTPWLAVGEALAEELINKKIEKDIEEGEEHWSAEEVKDKLKEVNNLKIKFVRTFMGLIE